MMKENIANSSVKESISALLDEEANDLDLQRILKSLEDGSADQASVRDTWSKYERVGALVRNEAHASFQFDISASVREAIDQEQNVSEQALPSGNRRYWWRDIAGKTAIAATVTFAVIMGVQEYAGVGPSSGEGAVIASNSSSQVAPASVGAVVPEGFEQPNLRAATVSAGGVSSAGKTMSYSVNMPTANRPSESVRVGEIDAQDVNRLLYLHAKQVSENSAMGVLPYARVQSIEESQ